MRRQIESFNRRDPEAMAADWHPEGTWEPASVTPVEGTPYVGPDGIRTFLDDYASTWEDFRLDYGEFVDLGEQVLALGRRSRLSYSDSPTASRACCWSL